MRKGVIGLSLLLIFSSTATYSATPIKAGSVCSKQGITKTFKGKKYTCIKSAKKLVWNKGVLIEKTTPTPSTNTEKTIAGDPPLPFDGCGYGWYYYRINNGVMERSFYPNTGYASTDPRPSASFDPIRVKAYEAIRSHRGVGTNLPTIEYRISESFPKDVLSNLKSQLEFQVAYWSDRFKPGSKVIATFTTEKDRLILNPNITSNYEDALGVADVYSDNSKIGYLHCGWRSGIAGAHTLWTGPNYGTIGYWIVFPSNYNEKYWDPDNLPHEFIHGIQDLIWIADEYPYGKKYVYNLIEGGAELLGNALGYSTIGWYNDEINRKIVGNYIGFEPFRMIPKNTNDVLFMLGKSEINDNGAGSAWAFTVGLHLWEYLIANYGFDSYWQIVRKVQKAGSYDDAIKQTVGISKLQLYADAAPYILKQFKIALEPYANK